MDKAKKYATNGTSIKIGSWNSNNFQGPFVPSVRNTSQRSLRFPLDPRCRSLNLIASSTCPGAGAGVGSRTLGVHFNHGFEMWI